MTGHRRPSWWRRRRQEAAELPPQSTPEIVAAQGERASAQRRLAEARRLTAEAAVTVERLRQINQRNHFAELVRAALGEHR